MDDDLTYEEVTQLQPLPGAMEGQIVDLNIAPGAVVEPRHISVQAGDKIWILRDQVELKPNLALSSEDIEVIDVVKK